MKDNVKNIVAYKLTSSGVKMIYSCKDHHTQRSKLVKFDNMTKKDQKKIKAEAARYSDILDLLQQNYLH